MTADHTPARNHIRFGRFALDLVERRLTCSDQPVKLSSKALDILCELASANGAVVDKNRIMDKVWPGRVVEENAIQVHVSSLRKALEAGSDGHSYVMTVPGRGYRLLAWRLSQLRKCLPSRMLCRHAERPSACFVSRT